MNYLPEEKQLQVLRCITEGASVRGTARMVGISKDTVERIVKRVGIACEDFHHRYVHDVPAQRVELDELHAFNYGKTRCLPEHLKGTPGIGTIWTWLGLTDARLIISYAVGGRDITTCKEFVADVAYRLRDRVQITSDAWSTYEPAILKCFRAASVDYATVDKDYVGFTQKNPEHRYSPGKIRRCVKKVVFGNPDPAHMTTSHVERMNLGLRMANQRYRRLTNAHSKSIRYHRWALAIHVVFYNWCRVNAAVKMTPAQASGLTEYRFSVKDLLHIGMWRGDAVLQPAL